MPGAIIALGLLVSSGASLAGKSEADVTPAPLDMSIVQGFAAGGGATKKAATAAAQSAVETKTEAPMAAAPIEPVVAPVPASTAKDGAAAAVDTPQGPSSTLPEVSAVSVATPAAEPKSSVTPTTLDRSIIQGFANDTMQPAGATSAATSGGSGGAPAPVPASTPDKADASSKVPLPDDQMNLIRETFSGDG
jgi:hypothetical protein